MSNKPSSFTSRWDHYKESTKKFVKISRENSFRLLVNQSPASITAYFTAIEVIERAMGKKLKNTDQY